MGLQRLTYKCPLGWLHNTCVNANIKATFHVLGKRRRNPANESVNHQRFEFRKEEIAVSLEAWKHVFAVNQLNEHTPVHQDKILLLLTNLEQLEQELITLPRTLIHGDFHMENCVLDDSRNVVIIDWQSPKLGAGAEDAGNFLARAELYGNPLSTNTYIDLYIALLESSFRLLYL